MTTTDTFTDAAGRHFVAGDEVSEQVMKRVMGLQEEVRQYRRTLTAIEAECRQTRETRPVRGFVELIAYRVLQDAPSQKPLDLKENV